MRNEQEAGIPPFLHSDQINIGDICTRYQCEAGLGDKIAMSWVDSDMTNVEISFIELDRQSNLFASALKDLGAGQDDVLFTFLPKMAEQFYAVLGSLKCGLLTGTLFANFADEALLDRLGDSGAKILVTKKSFLKKINRIRDRLPLLSAVILVDGDGENGLGGIFDYKLLVERANPFFVPAATTSESPSILHYTSGSTGKPKGVVHAHRSVRHQSATCREVLGLRSDDIFWCTADQGWVTGTSYGIIGPWSLGVTQMHFGGGYDPEKWFELLQRHRVTVWYTAPTALRMLMREDDSLFRKFDLSALRSIFSVGEPLNPEINHWSRRVLHKEIYDTWFQTETGGIMISNRPGLDIRPGSMGKPVDAVDAAILDEKGLPVADGEQGNLCLRSGWSSMFKTYLNNSEVYDQKFQNGYYFTGDEAVKDADGYYWFKGRCDDVINTGGHLISPFEIESALLELEEVAEAGVIGVPDEMLFEKIVVYLSVHRDVEWGEKLEIKIRLYLSNRVSSLATPHQILCCDNIPKNKSGKIMRRVLKARYLNQDEGDLSTLED